MVTQTLVAGGAFVWSASVVTVVPSTVITVGEGCLGGGGAGAVAAAAADRLYTVSSSPSSPSSSLVLPWGAATGGALISALMVVLCNHKYHK